MEREMQSIDGILENVTTADADVPAVTPRKRTRLTGVRRVMFALTSLTMASGLSVMSAPPVAASVSLGNGYGTEIVFCNAATHTIEVDTTIAMSLTGAVSYPGQLTAVRIQYYRYATAKWYTRSWRTGYAFPYYYATETLPLVAGRWLVYVDFGWWNGSQWTFRSEYAPVYWQTNSNGGGGGRTSTCYL
jgi:hypothetical protein